MSYGLLLRKENFKFSASHFTVFSADEAEALHGHNYQVGVSVTFDTVDPELEMKLDFKTLKDMIRKVCDSWDEKILVPEKSPFIKVGPSPHYLKHLQVEYKDRFYCFPENEVIKMPLSNITSEGLARHFSEKLSGNFQKHFLSFTVFIKETSGQTARFTKKF